MRIISKLMCINEKPVLCINAIHNLMRHFTNLNNLMQIKKIIKIPNINVKQNHNAY